MEALEKQNKIKVNSYVYYLESLEKIAFSIKIMVAVYEQFVWVKDSILQNRKVIFLARG